MYWKEIPHLQIVISRCIVGFATLKMATWVAETCRCILYIHKLECICWSLFCLIICMIQARNMEYIQLINVVYVHFPLLRKLIFLCKIRKNCCDAGFIIMLHMPVVIDNASIKIQCELMRLLRRRSNCYFVINRWTGMICCNFCRSQCSNRIAARSIQALVCYHSIRFVVRKERLKETPGL
jgi:hypothetical protein